MDSSDWSNGIRYHIFYTRPKTESNFSNIHMCQVVSGRTPALIEQNNGRWFRYQLHFNISQRCQVVSGRRPAQVELAEGRLESPADDAR